MATAESKLVSFGRDASGANVATVYDPNECELGTKGTNLVIMAGLGLPVPPGFVLPCAIREGYLSRNRVWDPAILSAVRSHMDDLQDRWGRKFGDAKNPLLVSVRASGHPACSDLPETLLNVGLNDESVQGLATASGDEKFAWDSYCRLIRIFGSQVFGMDAALFDDTYNLLMTFREATSYGDLTAHDFQMLAGEFKDIFAENVDGYRYPELIVDGAVAFPQDPELQLRFAIESLFEFRSQANSSVEVSAERAPGYAVVVQAMVFGNRNRSATGVAFTRNPATGEHGLWGSYLAHAQGEEVELLRDHAQPLERIGSLDGCADIPRRLRFAFGVIEWRFKDMCDIEFTVEDGQLWILQSDIGKRTAHAQVAIAVHLANEGIITRAEAVMRVDAEGLDQLMHPRFRPDDQAVALVAGVNASPGAVCGPVAFTSEQVFSYAAQGTPAILVRWETDPDDFPAMMASAGILTSHGGKESYAAIAARGMDRPCVAGVRDLTIDVVQGVAHFGTSGVELCEGDVISLDGSTGEVFLGSRPLLEPTLDTCTAAILSWADEFRTMGVRVNADEPCAARIGLALGADGVGLCCTERVVLAEGKSFVQSYVLNSDSALREKAITDLFRLQVRAAEELLSTMDGRTVVIRLLDPPLYEFLEDPRAVEARIRQLVEEGAAEKTIAAQRKLLAKIETLAQRNPIMGLRGVRLGLVYPDLYRVQVRAIAEAASNLISQGQSPKPAILVPLVALASELSAMRTLVADEVARVSVATGVALEIPVGALIELPRAVVTADEIAAESDFLSFGTDDLTQSCFGFSREDAEAEFVPLYLDQGILQDNPFVTVDYGVARFVGVGTELARKGNPTISCGACGEHAGDAVSIKRFATQGIDYVSCAPYRVPLARIAAAQAALSVC